MKLSLFSSIIAATFLTVSAACLAQAPTTPDGITKVEIPNGGFENGLQNWDMRGKTEPTYRNVSKPEAFEGEAAGQIVLDGGSTLDQRQGAYFARVDFPTEVGYYRLRYAAKTDLQQGEFGAALVAVGEDDKPLLAIYPGQNGSALVRGKSDWKEYSLIYKLPAAIKKVILQLQVTNGLGSVALDNVRLDRLNEKTGKELMNEQSPQAPTLEDVGAQLLSAPCRVVNPLLATLYRDPVSGRTNLALNSCTPGQGSALLVDYQENKTTVIPFPVGNGGWDLLQIAPDKMLFESLEPLYVVPIDLKTKTIIKEGMKAVPNNQYAWEFSRGSDGWIYMGSYATAHLYRYHPTTYEVQDMGLMGPEGNLYDRHIAATSDGWILSSVMLAKSGVVAFNPQTKEQYMVENATNEKGEGIAVALFDVGGVVYATLHGELQQFDSAQKKFVPAILPPAPGGTKWTYILASSTQQRKVLIAGAGGTYYLVETGKEPLPVWNLNLRGGKIVGVDENNRVIGFRGQDYFVAEPMATEIKPIQIAQNPPPVGIHFLRADPQGGVTGGPNFGQTLFRFDPKRSLLHNTPQVVDGGGEVYDGRWVDGKFYFVAYAGGYLGVWNPNEEWDQWNGVNPRVLHAYNTAADGGLIRPVGGLVVGPQGRLYSAWSAQYGKMAGGLGEYDLKTNQSRSWTNEIFAPDMAIGSIAADDKYVYGVTSNSFSGIAPPHKPVVFWVFDPIAEKVVFKETLANALDRPAVVRVPETGNIWLAEPAGLRRFDVATLKFAPAISWPREAGAPASISASDARGNSAWFTANQVVVRLDDSAKPTATSVFAAQEGIGALAAGDDGQLYFTQGVNVWSAPQKSVP
jgi:hypothetical protein